MSRGPARRRGCPIYILLSTRDTDARQPSTYLESYVVYLLSLSYPLARCRVPTASRGVYDRPVTADPIT
jgi:hypothetical protein